MDDELSKSRVGSRGSSPGILWSLKIARSKPVAILLVVLAAMAGSSQIETRFDKKLEHQTSVLCKDLKTIKHAQAETLRVKLHCER